MNTAAAGFPFSLNGNVTYVRPVSKINENPYIAI